MYIQIRNKVDFLQGYLIRQPICPKGSHILQVIVPFLPFCERPFYIHFYPQWQVLGYELEEQFVKDGTHDTKMYLFFSQQCECCFGKKFSMNQMM